MNKKSEQVLRYRATYQIKRIDLPLTPPEYAAIKSAAANAGESMTAYAKRAIRDRIDRDLII